VPAPPPSKRPVAAFVAAILVQVGCGGRTSESPRFGPSANDGGAVVPEEDAPVGVVDAAPPNDDSRCADTQVDPHNCGTCGHDCLGGACEAGACQPVVLVTVPYSGVSSFAIDDASVYWTTDWTTNGEPTLASGTVSKCPLAGCTGNMRCGIDCNDDATIFYKVPYLTGEPFAANATQAFLAGPLGDVEECPTSGCIAPVAFASGQQTPSEIVVSGPSVYWINLVEAAAGRKGLSLVDSGVLTCPVSGCDDAGPMSLAGGMSPPTSLVVSGQTVYWAQAKSVVSCSASGCNGAPTTIASLSTDFSGVGGIAVDGKYVYFGATAVGSGMGPPGWEIMSCSLSGCPNGPTPLYSTSLESGGPVPQIFVDATRIYFVLGDGSEILALAK
jgi:hypothetical protein